MSGEQPRTDANSRDRSPDHQYSLSIEQTAELYAQAGYPRTIRAVQKYCALSKLDCHKVDTDTGEKYLVAPYSVERHIAYIKEVRTVATSRDQTRTDANVRPLENKDEIPEGAANRHEQPRTDAAVRGARRALRHAPGGRKYISCASRWSLRTHRLARCLSATKKPTRSFIGFKRCSRPCSSLPSRRKRPSIKLPRMKYHCSR